MKFGLVKKACYYYRKRYSETSLTSISKFKNEYFTIRFKYGYLELINTSLKELGYVPEFIQNILIYDLHWLVQVDDLNEIIETIYNDEESLEFYELFDKILSYIDYDVIDHHYVIPDYIKSFLIYYKI